MNVGQEFTHTVTTTVTDTKQSITNETQLTENGEVIIHSTHAVNIPLGATYDIEVTGDINGGSISRNFNVLNNLLGEDVFKFKDKNEATDTDLTKFTALYSEELTQFSGTAAINSLVRVVFEDGSSKTTLANSLGVWSLDMEATDLGYGVNNIVLLNGTRNDQIKVINITVDEPITPFSPEFTYQVNSAGTTISGTVEDARAMVKLQFGQVVQTVLVKSDKTWKYDLVVPLAHGASFDVYVEYGQETSDKETHAFYKATAVLDQLKGQYISGLSAPNASVQVTTLKYQTLTVIASPSGEWRLDFAQGLPYEQVVNITISGVELPHIVYIGASDITYVLTAVAFDSLHLNGTGRPGDELTIILSTLGSTGAVVDEAGNWSVTLSTAMPDGEQITVISENSQNINIVFKAPFVPVYTAYISNDGLSVFGTSNADQIFVELPERAEQQISVIAGEWTMTLETALEAGDLVTVRSGQASKTLQFIGIQSFTALLSAEKDKVTGTTDAGINAVIRVVFDDNAVVEKAVSGGAYELSLGRVLSVGEVIVVACMNEHGVQSSLSIDVE
jgi:hypothetical protein